MKAIVMSGPQNSYSMVMILIVKLLIVKYYLEIRRKESLLC